MKKATLRKWSRRTFIGAGTVAGGGFLLGVAGFTFAPARHSLVSADAAAKGQLTTWITVTPDNVVTILIPHCEMGQGSPTALAMMAAEEMEADWTLVRAQEAPARDAYANGYIARAAGGNYVPAVLGARRGLRRLQGRGVVRLSGDRRLHRGARHRRVRHARGRRRREGNARGRGGRAVGRQQVRMHGEAIAGFARRFGPDRDVWRACASGGDANRADQSRAQTSRRLYDPPHLDNASRHPVEGRRQRAVRHRLQHPGMLYAAIELAPVHGGKLISVDAAPAEAMPGVKKVVKLDEAVAVVADSFWRARRALAALKPEFSDAGHGDVSSDSIFAAFDKALGPATELPKRHEGCDRGLPRTVSRARDDVADGMHCKGRRRARRSVDRCAGSAERAIGRRESAGHRAINVRLTNFLLGGGFGRGLPFNFDYVDLGVRIAKAMAPAPVKTIWTRENDIQHDYYRGAAMSRHAGALDANGAPLAVHSKYTGGGNGEAVFMPYTIARPARRRRKPITRSGSDSGGRSSTRSMDSSRNRSSTRWRTPPEPIPSNSGAGCCATSRVSRRRSKKPPRCPGGERRCPPARAAASPSAKASARIAAEVVHVAVSPEGRLRVLHVYAAVDCGDVINVDTATAQVEGGIVFALSAACSARSTSRKDASWRRTSATTR